MHITQVTLLQILRRQENNCLRTGIGSWPTFRKTRTCYIHTRTPFIIPTKCTFLISIDIKRAFPACFGTYVPSSGGTQCHLLKTKCYCEAVIYRFFNMLIAIVFIGCLVCSSFVVDIDYM